MDRTDTTSDEYQALLAQLVKSHDHGYGRFRRMAWGAKEDCEQCMTQEKLMAEAREDFKVRFTDGTTAPVVDGLIGLTEDEEEAMAVNELIANEREYVDNITREAVFGLAFIVIGLFSFAVILTAVEGK